MSNKIRFNTKYDYPVAVGQKFAKELPHYTLKKGGKGLKIDEEKKVFKYDAIQEAKASLNTSIDDMKQLVYGDTKNLPLDYVEEKQLTTEYNTLTERFKSKQLSIKDIEKQKKADAKKAKADKAAADKAAADKKENEET